MFVPVISGWSSPPLILSKFLRVHRADHPVFPVKPVTQLWVTPFLGEPLIITSYRKQSLSLLHMSSERQTPGDLCLRSLQLIGLVTDELPDPTVRNDWAASKMNATEISNKPRQEKRRPGMFWNIRCSDVNNIWRVKVITEWWHPHAFRNFPFRTGGPGWFMVLHVWADIGALFSVSPSPLFITCSLLTLYHW